MQTNGAYQLEIVHLGTVVDDVPATANAEFVPPFSRSGFNATEANREMVIIFPIQLSNLTVTQSASDTTDNGVTVRVRIPTGDGNGLVTLPVSATTTVQDLTNRDIFSALDTMSFEADGTIPTAGTVTITEIMTTCERLG